MANPTAAGLVKAPQQWPGLITTRLGEVRHVERPDVYFRTQGSMPERVVLHCAIPSQFDGLEASTVHKIFFDAVAAQVRAARTRMRAEGRAFLGAPAVLKQRLSRAAASPEGLRTRTPRFAIRDRELRKRVVQAWRGFQWAYRDALREWRLGVRDVRFPEGTWALRVLHCATSGPPVECAA